MTYKIGDTFEGTYPVEAAEWCNTHEAMIEEIQSEAEDREGIRRYRIVDQPHITEDIRAIAKDTIEDAFDDYLTSSRSHFVSKLGFKANFNLRSASTLDLLIAKTEAKVDVDGDNKGLFRDFENVTHRLSLDELKVLRVEMASEMTRVHEAVWLAKSRLKKARTRKEIDSVVKSFLDNKSRAFKKN